jgi:hypothetical protein
LAGHDCSTVQEQGWSGKANGDLLRLAEVAFELFITADQNIEYQQNLTRYHIAVLLLSTNDLRRLRAAAEMIQQAVTKTRPGVLQTIDIP